MACSYQGIRIFFMLDRHQWRMSLRQHHQASHSPYRRIWWHTLLRMACKKGKCSQSLLVWCKQNINMHGFWPFSRCCRPKIEEPPAAVEIQDEQNSPSITRSRLLQRLLSRSFLPGSTGFCFFFSLMLSSWSGAKTPVETPSKSTQESERERPSL